jgi:hypothetical protein
LYVCGWKNTYFWKEKKDFREEKKVTDVFRTTNYVCMMGFRCLHRVVVEKMGHRTFCMYAGRKTITKLTFSYQNMEENCGKATSGSFW